MILLIFVFMYLHLFWLSLHAEILLYYIFHIFIMPIIVPWINSMQLFTILLLQLLLWHLLLLLMLLHELLMIYYYYCCYCCFCIIIDVSKLIFLLLYYDDVLLLLLNLDSNDNDSVLYQYLANTIISYRTI